MFVLSGNDVNDVYPMAITLLNGVGRPESSRYGDVIVAPRPVTSHYEYPRNRVLLDPHRDANPFFHLMESLWILSGRYDVEWLARFNSRIKEFSDNGLVFHGAYGDRLRWWLRDSDNAHGHTLDQLDAAVDALQRNPNDRRVVLSIWDPCRDLGTISKDIPCNDMIKVEIRDGRLNLIVFNRSNDVVWGCYGANVVQFSMIQEYLAGRIGVEMGFMEQVSTNWHAYTEVWKEKTAKLPMDESPYRLGIVEAYPLVRHGKLFDQDLRHFMRRTETFPDTDALYTLDNWGRLEDYANPFFYDVAEPMFLSWVYYKAGMKPSAHALAESVMASDWSTAATEWLGRRMGK